MEVFFQELIAAIENDPNIIGLVLASPIFFILGFFGVIGCNIFYGYEAYKYLEDGSILGFILGVFCFLLTIIFPIAIFYILFGELGWFVTPFVLGYLYAHQGIVEFFISEVWNREDK